MNYYPDHIADDGYDDEKSCLSAEIEGGSAAINLGASEVVDGFRSKRAGDASDDDSAGNDGGDISGSGSSIERKSIAPLSNKQFVRQPLDDLREKKDMVQASPHGVCHTRNMPASNDTDNGSKEQSRNSVAEMIRSERNRRLGIRSSDASVSVPKSGGGDGLAELAVPNNPNPVGVLGNIRGWFGGGVSGGGATFSSSKQSTMPKVAAPGPSRAPAPAVDMHGSNANAPHVLRASKSSFSQKRIECIPEDSSLVKSASHNTGDDHVCDGDSSSGTSSGDSSSDGDSDSSDHYSDDESEDQDDAEHLTPQERARARALRHLSGSCVDAGRRAKTSSYVRGLERLDLKRKRDRFEKELDVVESEMNKDRGLGGNNSGDMLERDEISIMASGLVRELPKIQGADAGAGSDGNGSFMSQDEYANSLDIDDPQQIPIWENAEAVNVYVTSLQSRLKEALERSRSLEKRLVVLEQAGDDIVSSLCEDLADVTGHSNKQEARYVKKGKELQRKRRREELRHRRRIKQAEMRVRELEKELLRASGGQDAEVGGRSVEDSDSSTDDSMSILNDDDDDDEVLLEKKLSSIKAKNELDKEQHDTEMDSIRRQCEQLKLRLSVARLVMEGDDNLREYITLLERLDPSIKSKRGSNCRIPEYPAGEAFPSPPPPRVTRSRARVLKVAHLEHMYERRLAVSKAFTDATINALEQELSEREAASQKMEVRCLNELMMIDSGIKDSVMEAGVKLSGLQSETRELEEAVAACATQRSIAGVNDILGDVNFSSYLSNPVSVKTRPSLDQESSSGGLIHSSDHRMEEEVTGLALHDDLALAKDRNDSKQIKNCVVAEEAVLLEHSTAEAMSRDIESCSNNSMDNETKGLAPYSDMHSVMKTPSSCALEGQDDCVEAPLHQHAAASHDGLEISGGACENKGTNCLGSISSSIDGEKCSLAEGRRGDKEDGFVEMHELEANAEEVAKGCDTIALKKIVQSRPKELFCIENHCKEMAAMQISALETIQPDGEEGILVTNENSPYTKQLVPSQREPLSAILSPKCKSFSGADTNDEALETEASSDEKNEKNCCEYGLTDSATAENFSSNPHSKGKLRASSKLADCHANNGLPSNDFGHGQTADAQDRAGTEKIDGNAPNAQNEAALEMLGRDLRFTLAEYQTSFDLSSSRTRIQQLDCMNKLIVNIARVSGLECQIENHCEPESGREELRSWSFHGATSKNDEKPHQRKRSKKKKKKKKKRCHDREGEDIVVRVVDPCDRHEQSVVW